MPDDELIAAARAARENAYAPYSGYAVGAAVRDSRGRIFAGSNVENASYGLSICAERAAVFQMASTGSRELAAAAVATGDGGTPCGACRQVLLEFAPHPESVRIECVGDGGVCASYTLAELLPEAFTGGRLRRTGGGS